MKKKSTALPVSHTSAQELVDPPQRFLFFRTSLYRIKRKRKSSECQGTELRETVDRDPVSTPSPIAPPVKLRDICGRLERSLAPVAPPLPRTAVLTPVNSRPLTAYKGGRNDHDVSRVHVSIPVPHRISETMSRTWRALHGITVPHCRPDPALP